MQATSIVSRQSLLNKRCVSTGIVARHYGLSIPTVISMCERGTLESTRTAGGHYRILTSSCLSYFEGIEQEDIVVETGDSKGCAIYARTSSDSQKKSLADQITRLKTEASEREQIAPDVIPVFQDCSSAFGKRDGLTCLVDAIIAGTVKRVYVEYEDRLARDSTLHLIHHLAKQYGCEIIALDVEESDPDELAAMSRELIAFVTVICNRYSAQKSRKVTVKEVSEPTLQRLFNLRNEGHSLTSIWKRAKSEGLTTEKGDTLSYYKIKEVLYNGKGKAIGAVIGKDATNPHDVLRKWVEENLEVIGDEKSKERVYIKEVRQGYEQYCATLQIKALPSGDIGQAINKAFPNRRFKTHNTIAYRGLKLKES